MTCPNCGHVHYTVDQRNRCQRSYNTPSTVAGTSSSDYIPVDTDTTWRYPTTPDDTSSQRG